jgi:pimeloyl-ACP methyl ester carboxylesterase
MRKILSKDGTAIAFDQLGKGPAIILVGGAFQYRAIDRRTTQLTARLASQFTVFHYDRRGRGESGDTPPYAVEREIEDLEALITEAGGTAFVFGMSSGASLSLEAANRLPAITSLALYEAPFIVDDSRRPFPVDFLTRLKNLIAEDRRGSAVKLFMKQVGTPAFFIAIMGLMPGWAQLKAVAHTLPYDITILEGTGSGKPLPPTRWASVTAPTLVMDGGRSPVWMRHAMQMLAQTLTTATYRTLEGQTHMVKPEVLAPALEEFFAGSNDLKNGIN